MGSRLYSVVWYHTVQHPNCWACPTGDTDTGKMKMAPQLSPWIVSFNVLVAKPDPFCLYLLCGHWSLSPWACNTPTQSAYMQCGLWIVWTAEVRMRSSWLKFIMCNVLCYGRHVVYLKKLQILLLPSLSIELNSLVLFIEEWPSAPQKMYQAVLVFGVKGHRGLELWKSWVWFQKLKLLMDIPYPNVCAENNKIDGYSFGKNLMCELSLYPGKSYWFHSSPYFEQEQVRSYRLKSWP